MVKKIKIYKIKENVHIIIVLMDSTMRIIIFCIYRISYNRCKLFIYIWIDAFNLEEMVVIHKSISSIQFFRGV